MFSPGQEIVAIRNHPDGAFKKGQIFFVIGTRQRVCTCQDFLVDIGLASIRNTLTCACSKTFSERSGKWWFTNKHFALLASKEGEAVMEEAGGVL